MQLIWNNEIFIKIKLSYVCMIFFVKENKVKDSYIEERQYKHGNKTVRLDDSVFFDSPKGHCSNKNNIGNYGLYHLQSNCVRQSHFLLSVSHGTLYTLTLFLVCILLKHLLTVKSYPSYYSLKKFSFPEVPQQQL